MYTVKCALRFKIKLRVVCSSQFKNNFLIEIQITSIYKNLLNYGIIMLISKHKTVARFTQRVCDLRDIYAYY